MAELRPEALLLGIEIETCTNYIYLCIQEQKDNGPPSYPDNIWNHETYSTDLEYVRKLVRGLYREYHKLPKPIPEFT